jgi:RNA polymerase sigma-70 factor (ECF subfamily)
MTSGRRRFDRRLHTRFLRREPQAIVRLAREMLEPLYGLCFYRVGGNHHLCEEVVQETLLRALQDADRYDPARSRGHIFGWLTGLARRVYRQIAEGEWQPRFAGVQQQLR